MAAYRDDDPPLVKFFIVMMIGLRGLSMGGSFILFFNQHYLLAALALATTFLALEIEGRLGRPASSR